MLNGWEWKELSEVAVITMGQSPPSNTYTDNREDMPFFQGKAEFGKRYPSVVKYCSAPKKTAKKNDILMSVRAPVGAINIADVDCCIGRGLCSIRPKDMDLFYLYHILKSKEKEIEQTGQGSTFKAINQKELRKIRIPVPPLPIQKQIASILERAESLREKRQKANDDTNKIIQSIFYKMFGDPVKNEKRWDINNITQLAKDGKHAIKAGPFGSSLKKECYVEKGYKIYGQEQVIVDNMDIGDYYISEEKYKEMEAYKVSEGDVLISLVGTFGKISVVPHNYKEGIINPRLIKISLNSHKMLPQFMKCLLTSDIMKRKIEENSHGGTMGIINLSILKQLKIITPPIDKQKKFVVAINKITLIGNKQKEGGVEINHLFDALMQKAFAGELVT